MKTVILESLGISEERLKELEAPFKEKGMEFASFAKSTDEAELVKEAQGADAVIIANMPFHDPVISRLPDLRYIDVAFTGVDHVGLDACRKQGIHVSNASGYSNEAVAELAVGSAIAMYRSLKEADARTRAGQDKGSLMGLEIKGKTVGIIGLGKIGMRSAELFHAFGAKILASKKHPCTEPEWITLTDTDTVLKEADLVVLHLPLNEETRGMIDASKIALMKKNAVLINLARGPVVKTDDLVKALNSGAIAGAVSDVYEEEPPLDKDAAILEAEHTLLTPHIGFATQEAMEIRAQIVFANLEAWMNGTIENRIL